MARFRVRVALEEALLFLRQSLRSDYCAVYASGMLLSLLGVATDRRQARQLFGVRPGHWRGSTHRQIRQVLCDRVPGVAFHWRHSRRGRDGVCDLLRTAAAAGQPALVTAYCRHPRLQASCGHAFLLTGARMDTVLLLDPLGRPPAAGERFNACLDAAPRAGAADAALLEVDGVAWSIDSSRRVSVLIVSAPDPA